jgi:hypothetical protein
VQRTERFIGVAVRAAPGAPDDAPLGSDSGCDRTGGDTGHRRGNAETSAVHAPPPM